MRVKPRPVPLPGPATLAELGGREIQDMALVGNCRPQPAVVVMFVTLWPGTPRGSSDGVAEVSCVPGVMVPAPYLLGTICAKPRLPVVSANWLEPEGSPSRYAKVGLEPPDGVKTALVRGSGSCTLDSSARVSTTIGVMVPKFPAWSHAGG